MKKIFTTLAAALMMSAQIMAVGVKDVCGQFQGDLNIGGEPFPSKSIYLLPGTTANTLTFVLPNFEILGVPLGSIVLPNIQMDAEGTLSIEPTTLWLDTLELRANISILQGHVYKSTTYNSIVSADHAEVVLEIAEPVTLPDPIIVIFSGDAVRTNNYAIANGGFEGAWTNNEPEGWHSFGTATGIQAKLVKGNTYQFVPSTEVRPGSKGTQSAIITSNFLFGVKANGNATNGYMNAGSMTASDATGNYNFSDPDSVGFNTPFQGRPDSIVFWAKYQPADRDVANEANKARVNCVLTTNARYQDPETASFGEARIAKAELNYSANAQMDWQRLAVAFDYTKDEVPAYILTTFSTNATPGGGSTYKVDDVKVLDTVYIDDVELIYKNELDAFTRDKAPLSFTKHVATVESSYCDDCAKSAAIAEGKSAQTFIAYDATHKCIFVYVIADDYAQSGAYNIYRVDFADTDTEGLDPLPTGQGIEGFQMENCQVEKVLINGQIYIRRDNVWFTIMGARVQ